MRGRRAEKGRRDERERERGWGGGRKPVLGIGKPWQNGGLMQGVQSWRKTSTATGSP